LKEPPWHLSSLSSQPLGPQPFGSTRQIRSRDFLCSSTPPEV
jgi:hypothetical protein